MKFYGRPEWPVSALRTDAFLHVNLLHRWVFTIGWRVLEVVVPTLVGIKRAASPYTSDEPKVGDLCSVCGEPLDERDVRLCLFDHEGCL